MACHGCGRDFPTLGCYGEHGFSTPANAADAGSTVAVATLPRDFAVLAGDTRAAEDDDGPVAATPAHPNRTAEMKRDLRSWGGWLMVGGVAQIILTWLLDSSVLDALWSVVLLMIGALVLLVPMRSMYVLLGLAMLVAGLTNVVSDEIDLLTALGVVQLYLAGQQVRSFRKYGRAAG
jgi:hypothetical protein